MMLADTCHGAMCPIDMTALFDWLNSHPEVMLIGFIISTIYLLLAALYLWMVYKRSQGQK